MTFFSRLFAGPSDLSLLVNWLPTIRPRERVTDYPSIIDLPPILLLPANQETARLWVAETGELLGFAFVDAFSTLRFELDWQRTNPALEAAIVDWGKDCLAKTAAAVPGSLYATAHETDQVRKMRQVLVSSFCLSKIPRAIAPHALRGVRGGARRRGSR